MIRTLPAINELFSVMEGKNAGSTVELGATTVNDFTRCEIYNGPEPLTTVSATPLEQVIPELTHMESDEYKPACCFVESCDQDCLSNVKVTLENEALWKKFHSQGNEMMVTKPGRRMFPVLRLRITGLLPFDLYKVAVDFVFVDKYRYRFLRSENTWRPLIPDESVPAASYTQCKEHRDSPANGQGWTSQPVSFENLRLTNQLTETDNVVYVPTMRKYRIRLVVTKLHCARCEGSHTRHIDIPLTEFITVTTYHNPEIVQLKIDNNPLAKVFRAGNRSSARTSAKSQQNNPRRIRKRKRDNKSSTKVETSNLQVQPSILTRPETSSVTISRPTPYINLKSALLSLHQEDGIVYPRLHHLPCACHSTDRINGCEYDYITNERSHPHLSSTLLPGVLCPQPETLTEIPAVDIREVNTSADYNYSYNPYNGLSHTDSYESYLQH